MNRLRQVWNDLGNEFSAPREKDDHVLIIDGLNTFIRVFSVVPSLNDDGQHVGGVIGFLKSVGANIRQFQATRCIIVFDGIGGSSRRRKLYPDYKMNRKNRNKLNRHEEFKDLVDESASMRSQFSRIVEYLDTLPVTVISIDNIEADDTIAYITKQYYETSNNKITIVSSDRDFLQLVNENIRVWSPVKKKLYTPDKIQDEYGIPVNNYLMYRMLTGDTSDNINGVPGVGLKTLINRFPNIVEEEYSVDKLINESIEHVNNSSKIKLYDAIIENKNIIERNFKLMQLSITDISASSKLKINDLMNASVNKMDIQAFKKMFLQDKLYVNIKDVNTWLRETFKKLDIYA